MHGSLAGTLAAFIIGVLSATGYLGLLLLMAVESACIPLPSEIILPFAGYLVSVGKMNLVAVATVGALGCNLGSAVAYAVGRYGGRPAVRRWGKWVLLTDEDLRQADRFFQRFGAVAVLIGRLLPVVRTFIALPAGITAMPPLRFHIYTFLGSWPWCFFLAYVGYQLGEHWSSTPALGEAFHYADIVIAVAVVLFVARFVWHRRRNRTQEEAR
jgi:membrane protein DedA with SNARE-associated domain